MAKSIVVVPGPGDLDLTTVNRVASEFGWHIHVAHTLRDAAEVQAHADTVAILADCKAIRDDHSWPETIGLLGRNRSEARLVVCYGFGDAVDWPELCDAGAFHALRLPLQESELRQSLGFVWEAERRLALCRPLHVVAAA